MATPMSEVCLHLLTSAAVNNASSALEKIWDINNWAKNIARVIDLEVIDSSEKKQHLLLSFDAGRGVPDRIEVERIRTDNSVIVRHIIPPPGIASLSAVWWYDLEIKIKIFARRTIFISPDEYSPERARQMFGLLRESLSTLVKGDD